MVERRGGKFKYRSLMETVVWWSAGGGSSNKEASWRPLSGGAQGGESLNKDNKEEKWRALSGGAQVRGKLNKEASW